MGVSETQQFQESMAGEYFGIGAHVNKAGGTSPLEIRKVLYGGPAHKAGVRSNDRVLAIDGRSILDLSIDEVIDQLKGPANSKITLTVRRPGRDGDEEFVILRGRVEVQSVFSDLLPGNVGYIRLAKFGDRSAEDFIAAIDKLEERGLEGLIVDLRDNPGGRRDAAVSIVDQFVDGELPILTQKGRTGDEISTPPDPFRRPNYPMVVLVNRFSASASEIVAGALQDYRRATVVGERTFGKGSVQRVIQMSPLAASTLGGDARLRLTVQYYFLPSGKCIHTIRDRDGRIVERGGIDPDIVEDAETIPEWEFLARERIHRDDEILKYAIKHFEELKRLHDDADGRDPSRYPGFDALYEKWKTTASKNDLRSVLRLLTRRRLEDDRGSDFACDYLEDRQLQRGIVEVLDDLGKDPSSYAPYRRFKEWLAEEPEDRHPLLAPASDTPEAPAESEPETEPDSATEPDSDPDSDSGSDGD
jgi:C-terminal peptidase prc